MNAVEDVELVELVQRVRSWPAPRRIVLARQILETLESLPAPKMPRGPSAAEIAATFKGEKSTPDESTVKQWIADYRLEKYGK